MMEDNSAALKWCYNPVNHSKQKHMERAEFSVRDDVCHFKTITVHLIPTLDQLSDCLTKSLPLPAFKRNINKLLGEDTSAPRDLKAHCNTPESEVEA